MYNSNKQIQQPSYPSYSAFEQPVYMAGIGMITSIGFNALTTAAAVKAGVCGYCLSRFMNKQGNPIQLALVPDEVFTFSEIEDEDDDVYSIHYDRILKIAIISIKQAISGIRFTEPVPLILAVPDKFESDYYIPHDLLLNKLLAQPDFPFKTDMVRFISTGRAAGVQTMELVYDYLYNKGVPYVLMGGSDSYNDSARLDALDVTERLLAPGRMDGFAAGEGAGFILFTKNIKHALVENNNIIALGFPGIAHEEGHLYSDKTYKGDGLDAAFKQALQNYSQAGIETLYSSMNGENHWAKEYGVAMMRNKASFKDSVTIEHPAECYGDLGAATGPVLMGMSAYDLKKYNKQTNLIYSSSDRSWRAAVLMQKIAV